MTVPESGIVKFRFEPSEVIVRLPLDVSIPAEAKSTVKEVLVPGLIVIGTAKPFRLNPGPVMESAEIVTLVPPLLFNLTP